MKIQSKNTLILLLSRLGRGVAACLILLFFQSSSFAAVLSAELEVKLIKNVSTSWQTVSLDNSYSNAIPICTYNLISFSGSKPNYDYPPAVVRVRNITSSSFQLRIQGWEDTAAVTSSVHCIIAETGVHTLPSGTKFEAHSVLSDQTVGKNATDGAWNLGLMEDVSATLGHTYTDPVVLGQVITHNDNRASVFYTNNCKSRQKEPFQAGFADGICVGKHIGAISGSRNSETVGYLVAETGSGTANGISYELGRGADSVNGNSGGNVGYSYPVGADYTIGVATQVGEDGGDGSWAVLYGADPLPAGEIILGVDEEIFEADQSRNHTNEIVDYWVFGTAEVTLQKTVINNNSGTATDTDFNLLASGPDSISGVEGDVAITDVSVAPGSYSLSETGPFGYNGSWSCTGGALSGSTLTLNVGDDVICTLTNDDIKVTGQRTRLTLVKNVVNDEGGTATDTDFILSYNDGASISGSGVTGDASISSVLVAPGNYNLAEQSIQGYTLTSITCSGNDADGMDGLKITKGEKVTCTFTNEDGGIDLSVVKAVSDNSPNIGDVVTFTINVSNNGSETATDFHVVDVVNPGFAYIAGSMTGGNAMIDTSPSGTGLDWQLVSLASGASVVLTFQATVLQP